MGAATTETSPVHLIGVGGSGMAGLARLLWEAGHEVSGSDAVGGPVLGALGALGIRVAEGHDARHVQGAGRVVVSPVIPTDNVELKAARAAGLAVQSRAKALAELLHTRPVIAIAGSHGKTTTTAMLALVLRGAGLEPGYYLGGTCAALGEASALLSPGGPFVLEACEAFGALEHWRPAHVLVTNVDDEHLEHYGGQDRLGQAFQDFVGRVPAGGAVLLCGDDPGAAALEAGGPGAVVTYGLEASNQVRGEVIQAGQDASVFAVWRRGERLGEVVLPAPGLHNVSNALGVAAMALELGVGFETIATALAGFRGADRRWMRVGAAAGVEVFDDFAHHPTEIDVVLRLARARMGGAGKLVVAFTTPMTIEIPRLAQPLGRSLSAADLVLLAPLASAGGASYEQLAGAVHASGTPHVRVSGVDQLAAAALGHLAAGDFLLTLGPGAIGGVGAEVLEGLVRGPKAGAGDGWSISQGRARPAEGPACLASLVLDQARRRPDAPAVQCGHEVVSYRQLAQRAATVAAALADAGLEAGGMVAVSLERTAWRACAFLGLLMAGGAYLPVDPALPLKRQRLMLADARARFAIAPEGSVEDAAVRVIDPAVLGPRGNALERPFRPRSAVDPAYMIYTSGTTGRPKGVLIEQAALANFAVTAAGHFGIDQTSRVSGVSAFGFDVAVGEMSVALASGACLIVPSEAAGLGGAPLGRLIREQGVTHLFMTPSALATVPLVAYPDLSHVIVAGEACPPDLAERWGRGRAFFNAYGPTEATVLVTFDRHVPGEPITIGRAMDNACAFVLDEHEQAVRPGTTGELWLSGAGLARGYFRRKELTAERFRSVRPDGKKPVRAYRTGDLAAMLPDGRIRYLGRADDQVKLRGFRIELGEIEACLRFHPDVSDAAVALRRDAAGHDRLVAYVVGEGAAAPPSAEVIREFVGARLPAHMIPAAVMAIAAVPLSPNGKRDRSALPDPPRLSMLRDGRPAKRPRAGLENRLHALFRRELAIDDEFGVRDTLVDLGVDSLKTANLFLAVETAFGVELPAETAASANTIELLAVHLRQLMDSARVSSTPEPTLAEAIVRRQQTYLAAWTGRRRVPDSLIFTRGRGDGGPALFWCCQGDEEHARLAAALGPGRVVHAMRSGHLIFRYDAANVGALASRYVEEIAALQPSGPLRLGGNCQGGIIMQECARRLAASGREVELLFLIDPGLFSPMAAPVALIFGADSEQNPYRGGATPEPLFDQACPAGYSVHFLPGVHGLYFESPALEVLAKVITERLAILDRSPAA